MPMWTKTGNQLVEKRNNFLRDLAHGLDVTYRETQTVGGEFDPATDTMKEGTTTTVDTPYPKSLLVVPMKTLDDGESDGTVRGKLTVAGGHRIEGLSIDQTLVGRMHPRVPLNFQAVYVVGGQTYKLDRILGSVAVGALPFWNDVVLTRA